MVQTFTKIYTFTPAGITNVLTKTSRQVRENISQNMSFSRRIQHIKKHTDYNNLVTAIKGNRLV